MWWTYGQYGMPRATHYYSLLLTTTCAVHCRYYLIGGTKTTVARRCQNSNNYVTQTKESHILRELAIEARSVDDEACGIFEAAPPQPNACNIQTCFNETTICYAQ